MIDENARNYCQCSTQSTTAATGGCGDPNATFTIRRNDTCPKMRVVVCAHGQPVDLTGWTAVGMLFAATSLASEALDTDTVLNVLDAANIGRGDPARFESDDAPREWIDIHAVDKLASTITVARGHRSTMPATHPSDTPLVVVKAEDVPVAIEMTWIEDPGIETQVTYIDDDGTELTEDEMKTTLKSTELVVNWRTSDTARVGQFLMQITLKGPGGERLTLPRNSNGYPIIVTRDADDQV
jgi:hypothetical protein